MRQLKKRTQCPLLCSLLSPVARAPLALKWPVPSSYLSYLTDLEDSTVSLRVISSLMSTMSGVYWRPVHIIHVNWVLCHT